MASTTTSSNHSHRISTGLALSQDYYLRNFYTANTNASKTSYRKNLSKLELSYEDSRALRKAASRISSFKFDETDNEESIQNSVMAYVDTYNNAINSSKSDSSLRRYANELKSYVQKNSDKLSDIGIEINRDGTMKASKNLLEVADLEDIKELFGDESEFSDHISKISRKINRSAGESIRASMTGTGMNINIIL